MIRQWGHGHTLAAGLAGGLLLDRHVLYVFALGLIIGALIVYSSRTLRSIGRAGAGKAAELHALAVDKLRAEIERKRAAVEEANAKVEHRIRRADEQRAAEKKAYIQGAIDSKP